MRAHIFLGRPDFYFHHDHFLKETPSKQTMYISPNWRLQVGSNATLRNIHRLPPPLLRPPIPLPSFFFTRPLQSTEAGRHDPDIPSLSLLLGLLGFRRRLGSNLCNRTQHATAWRRAARRSHDREAAADSDAG